MKLLDSLKEAPALSQHVHHLRGGHHCSGRQLVQHHDVTLQHPLRGDAALRKLSLCALRPPRRGGCAAGAQQRGGVHVS